MSRTSPTTPAATATARSVVARDARQIGSQVVAHLSDPAWIDLPAADKKGQLEAALSALAGRGVSSLVILDDENVARASIQDQGDRTYIRFF